MSDEQTPTLVATPLKGADLISITHPGRLSREAHDRLKASAEGCFGPLRVLVLEEGATIHVHRPGDERAASDLAAIRSLLEEERAECRAERRRRRA